MYGPKNKRGALAALLAAGGLWAWQNRDKIRGFIEGQRQRLESQGGGYVGETRRIGQHYANVNGEHTGDARPPQSYDPKI
jgi:hypothetical protein